MKKIGIVIIILVLLSALLTSSYFTYLFINKNKDNEEIINKLNQEISILKENSIQKQEEISTKSNEIVYVPLTEQIYKNFYFQKIKNIVNEDNTITIQGKLYKIKDLPILTDREYKDLLAGKSITLLNHKFVLEEEKSSDDPNIFYIWVENSNSYEFSVDKNNLQLGYTREQRLREFTGIYAEVTIDADTPVSGGEVPYGEEKKLGEIITKTNQLKEMPNLYLGSTDTENMIFENDKVVYINLNNN